MTTETFEIIELTDGDIALRRAGHDEAPLVRIRFSSQSLNFLQDHKISVAKAMMEAGIQAVQEIHEDSVLDEEEQQAGAFDEDAELDEIALESRTLH
ncbi:hypothetical protein [Biformimicrobium ophioploci]|uniref:Uncharacterized protein n=1 Tax=Biformimicrobium ophioploci TaxID=3036711 RepID=A0ABQ6M1G9_9GAMM|nr:hypothetical protein [Microbulbifer sp. NKW57]GMG88163.1 hypothetical protein MNKW57_24840 [Microbulbifer sp. NKW57]